ncbi:FAD-dependent oxidoreductase [Rhodococcoides trifolii]|uniref:FAD-dependent oxidoreductase n=1 Tax=Rhodococcoides trifolii TaxID=908250 RepID=A0A917G787_9NOCA|nr:FAD-dependent monooxygenase [Rhodococcus trifolii]GGG25331.1 FAD-dependent oxidoreductase [Rhodococcus trifolii]
MSGPVHSALVIGGGIAGTAAAIGLARGGVEVDLVEQASRSRSVGSGITLQGNALRVLRELGVWDRVRAAGYEFNDLGLRAPDAHGTLLVQMDDARMGGPDLPATLGMERPVLATILGDAAEEAGVKLRFGTTVTALAQDASGVDVDFGDGASRRYDIVIGADGVRSWTRRTIGVDVEPAPTGMGIWRLVGPRPESVTRTDLYYGGAGYIAGYCPTGPNSLYAYIVEDARDRSMLSKAEQLHVMLDLAAQYHGPWDDIREQLTDPDAVNYTWFEAHVIDGPWHRGRVVLIGDAAHCCPPTLAQGGAQALEDASVLTELLLAADTIDDSVLTAFADRRRPRARAVVDASVQLGAWMLEHRTDADVPGLMGRIAALVSEPA